MTSSLLEAVQAPPPVLRVSRLSVSFRSVRALTEIDLTIGAGELVALTGEPGAGEDDTRALHRRGPRARPRARSCSASRPVPADPRTADRRGIAVVWQDLALCDNLDVAGNLLLGQETPRLMLSDARFTPRRRHCSSACGSRSATRRGSSARCPAGQRQLVAVAKAISRDPRLLLLDEPTASLAVAEAGQVEELIAGLREQGTAILLASRDIEQMFRLADRIVVLRHGRHRRRPRPGATHPDDVARAPLRPAGRLLRPPPADAPARPRRPPGLGRSVVQPVADPVRARRGARGRAGLHPRRSSGRSLCCAASLGFAPGQIAAWARLPFGADGRPAGRAAAAAERVVEEDLATGDAWARFGELAARGGARQLLVGSGDRARRA